MKPIRLAIRLFPVAVLLLLALGLLVVTLGRVDRTVEAMGEVGINNYLIVRPRVSGFVTEILVEPGDMVTRGQVLLRLEDFRFENEIRGVRQAIKDVVSRLEQAQSELRLRREVIHPLERSRQGAQIVRKDLETALSDSRSTELELKLETARQRHLSAQELSRNGLTSQQQLHEASQEELIAELRLRRSQLEARLAHTQGPSAQRELQLLEAEQQRLIADLKAQICQLELDAENRRSELRHLAELQELHTLRTNLDGVVIGQPTNDLRDRYVRAGEELFQILDPASIYFASWVPEEAIVQVRSGQPAQIVISGLPVDRFEAFWGTVSRVDQRPEISPEGSSLYPVRIQLQKPWLALADGRYYLRGGMRGSAEIAYRRDIAILRVFYEFLVGVPQIPERGIGSRPGQRVAPYT